jgi:excinuclease ABC subunit A
VRGRRGALAAPGTPEDVAKVKESYTGRYLRELLGRRSAHGRRAGGAQEKGKRQTAE